MASNRAAAILLSLFIMMGMTCAQLQITEERCNNMVAQVNELKAAIEAMCSASVSPATSAPTVPPTLPPYSPYKWTSVPLTNIGSTNLQHSGTVSFTIPSVIPSSAREVLIHAAVHTGHANTLHQNLKFFTQIRTAKYEKYLLIFSYPQNAINTNSDNMWFPMPPNRRVYLNVPTALSRYSGARLSAIGYR